MNDTVVLVFYVVFVVVDMAFDFWDKNKDKVIFHIVYSEKFYCLCLVGMQKRIELIKGAISSDYSSKIILLGMAD